MFYSTCNHSSQTVKKDAQRQLCQSAQSKWLCLWSLCWSGSDDSETVLSSRAASTVNCSPRWIVHPNTGAHGSTYKAATQQQQCLDACVADSSCVAADWGEDPGWAQRCWMHYDHHERRHAPGVTHFEIVRHCHLKSSTWRFFAELFYLSVVLQLIV